MKPAGWGVYKTKILSPDEIKDKGYNQAHKQASGEGKVKGEMLPLDGKISW
jgi:hypothetical protein